MVRELIVGRLDFRPNGDGDSCEFRGMGTLQPIIAGVVPHNLASPTGLVKSVRVGGLFRRAA